jgi:hypothetical protein
MEDKELDYNELHQHFVKNDWKWAIGGELQIPTADDLKKTVEHFIDKLEYEPVFAKAMIGRLVIEKRHHMFDVYVLFGTVND